MDEKKLRSSDIKYIPDLKIFRKSSLPNDPGISNQWAITNTKLNSLWLDKGYNCSNVVVAVVDTGVDYTHPDLSINILINTNEIPNNNIDDDNNGFKDDYYGYDFAYDDSNPIDGDGHGSHVAGIIGAVINNGIGIAGICNVKILPIKVLDDHGDGYVSDVYDGIIYAADRGAKVINLSMEANSTYSEYIQLFNNAFSYAKSKGVVVVAAAGNFGYNLESSTVLPASLRNNHPNMFVVTSHNSNNNLSSFSDYGGLVVDIAAPGENIYSTFKNGGYISDNGTSMASPFLAGVIAYLLSYEPNLSFQEIRNRIYNATVFDINFLGKTLTGGRLDLSKLFTNIDRPIITKIDDIRPLFNQTVMIEGAFERIDNILWNGRTVPFEKIDNNRIRFTIPFLQLGEDYGVLKGVYNGLGSNSIVIKPSGIMLDSIKINYNISYGTIIPLETGYYSVSGYTPLGKGIKFYVSSTRSKVALTVSKMAVNTSNSNYTEIYGALVDDQGNKWIVTASNGSYVYEEIPSNRQYTFVEVYGGSSSGGGGCFIATAAFGSYLDPHVKVLREFRDKYLMTNTFGRWLVEKYYKYSPPLAEYIKDKELFKFVVRGFLSGFIFIILYPIVTIGVVIVFIIMVLFWKKHKIKVNSL
ncbi:MAG: S8 family serine peptidase [Calditerrivibrio sp.]|nr:S8 family serine peptidase [Calditerrivibrio sp.]